MSRPRRRSKLRRRPRGFSACSGLVSSGWASGPPVSQPGCLRRLHQSLVPAVSQLGKVGSSVPLAVDHEEGADAAAGAEVGDERTHPEDLYTLVSLVAHPAQSAQKEISSGALSDQVGSRRDRSESARPVDIESASTRDAIWVAGDRERSLVECAEEFPGPVRPVLERPGFDLVSIVWTRGLRLREILRN